MEYREAHNEDELPQARFKKIPDMFRHLYDGKTLLTHEAVDACKSNLVNWVEVMKNILEEEFETMERSRASKSPGMSGFKHATIQFFPDDLKQLLRDLLQLIWKRQLVTELMVHVQLKLIPKPNGDQRGISLIEKITKNLEWVMAKRIIENIREPYKVDDVFSGLNRAYTKGRSTIDVLYSHAMVTQDAILTRNPLLVCMWDLAKCYDTIQIDLVEMVLGQMNAPRSVRRFLRALFKDSMITLSTQYQNAEPLRRAIGIHQGSSLSCLLLLIALEPMHRFQAKQMNEFAYRIGISKAALDYELNFQPQVAAATEEDATQSNSKIPMIVKGEQGDMYVLARPYGYSDDHNIYTSTVESMQTFLAMITTILAVLGIGFDDKVNIITFNVEGTHAIKANCYSRHTGLTEEVEITSKLGEDEEEPDEDEGERGMRGVKYKLLGIKFAGAYPDPIDNKRKVRFLIRKVLWRKLPMGLITQLLEQGVISKFVAYGVLLNTLSDENLAAMDTLMAGLGKHSMGLPVSAPRGTEVLTVPECLLLPHTS
jgi:hypothetical protein